MGIGILFSTGLLGFFHLLPKPCLYRLHYTSLLEESFMSFLEGPVTLPPYLFLVDL